MAQIVSRLALLMQMLDISNHDMARSLDIDNSLLCKWKNNQRRIPVRTEVLPRIVDYLVASDQEQGGRVLAPLLCPEQDIHPPDRAALTLLLTRWLQERSPIMSGGRMEQLPQIWLGHNNYICPIELYQGAEGRRTAILRFLDLAEATPPHTPVLLLTQEDQAWVTDDAGFGETFRLKLQALAATHAHLEQIFWLGRSLEDMQAMIHHWLPLHLKGVARACYHPAYNDLNLPLTLMVIPGRAVLFGLSAGGQANAYHTAICADPGSITHYEAVFRALQADCRPLLQHFRPEEIYALSERHAHLWQNKPDWRTCLQSPLPTVMNGSHALLDRILDDNQLDESARKHMLDCRRVFTQAECSKANGLYASRQVFLLESIEKAMHKPFVEDWLLSALAGHSIRISQNVLRCHLRNLALQLLQTGTPEIALLRSDLFHRSAWSNLMLLEGCFVAAWAASRNDLYLFMHEPTLVQGFQQYFDRFWLEIPWACRDRRQVADRLLMLADQPLPAEAEPPAENTSCKKL
jgi:hypothetical protein